MVEKRTLKVSFMVVTCSVVFGYRVCGYAVVGGMLESCGGEEWKCGGRAARGCGQVAVMAM